MGLGVVRSPDNAEEWGGIVQRLKSSGIAYEVIKLEQIQRASDLAGITILFLPNIETLTPTQVSVLEEWMSQGGRAIASGPLGSRSTASVRQTLRSLLGAYWAFPLPQPSVLQAQQICATPAQACATWVTPEAIVSPVQGGIVIPDGVESQTPATWKTDRTSSAVVANKRAIFFGWQWGSDAASPAEFDKAWLQAALNHYGYSFVGVSTPSYQGREEGSDTPWQRREGDDSTLRVPSPPPSTSDSPSLPPPPGILQPR